MSIEPCMTRLSNVWMYAWAARERSSLCLQQMSLGRSSWGYRWPRCLSLARTSCAPSLVSLLRVLIPWWACLDGDVCLSNLDLLSCIMHLSTLKLMIQSLVHLTRVSMFFYIRAMSAALRMAASSLVSSANIRHMQSLTDRGRSLINTMNSRGPSSDPCGTPLMTSSQLDIASPRKNRWRSLRKSATHFSKCSLLTSSFGNIHI